MGSAAEDRARRVAKRIVGATTAGKRVWVGRITRCSKFARLLDHFVGRAEQRERERKAERFGCLEIDRQLDFAGLLDRQIGGLLAFENPTSVDAGLAIRVGETGSVAHQPTGRNGFAPWVDGGNRVACRQREEQIAPTVEECRLARIVPSTARLAWLWSWSPVRVRSLRRGCPWIATGHFPGLVASLNRPGSNATVVRAFKSSRDCCEYLETPRVP